MAVVKMKKLSVIGMDEDKKSLITALRKLGAVEITGGAEKLADKEWQALVTRDSDDELGSEFDREITRADDALEVLKTHCKLKAPMFAAREAVTEAEYQQMLQSVEKYGAEISELMDLDRAVTETYAEGNQANALIASLTPWVTYDVPLDLTETEKTVIRTAVFPPATDMTALRGELKDADCAIAIDEIHDDKLQRYVALTILKDDEEEALRICKNYGYTAMPFNGLSGLATEIIEEQQKSLTESKEKREGLLAEIQSKADYEKDIKYYHDIMVIKRDESGVRSSLLLTETAFTFDGWVQESETDEVCKLLDGYTCWYELSEPAEDDDVPVKLHNNKFVTPLEFVTKMYSLPNFREIDPTGIFAIFYIIFFGIMFGDVGYGLIIVIATAIVLKKNKPEGSMYKLMRTLFYSGISSVFWGVMFGSVFGDLIQVTASTFFDKEITINPLWLDPAKEPMIFLVFSCGLGIVHLFVGMGIKGYQEIKDGQVLDAIKDVLAWYLIVLGLVMLIFGGMVAPVLTTVGMYMAIAGVAMALILPIFTATGAGKALGIWDLYSGVTGNLSDILSYSRLLGLGLASTSIAQVFNFLATMGGKSVVGVIMFLIITLLGHTLNFSINALGAFVHSCRLQYVEFFGKFYEGGGREFEPLGNNTKYINIIKEEK